MLMQINNLMKLKMRKLNDDDRNLLLQKYKYFIDKYGFEKTMNHFGMIKKIVYKNFT